MSPAHITRLMTFAQHGQPKDYAASDLMRADLEALIVAPIQEPQLHPRTSELVNRFAAALKEKLAAAEKKYGYSDAWAQPDWMDECRQKLREHIDKGDPRDVAAYCAFLWHHGEETAEAVAAPEAARRTNVHRFHCWRCGVGNLESVEREQK